MPYSFVWLYLMKCVFTCSIFVYSSTKIFLSVLSVFGKYFVLKNWKFQKSFFPCFGDSFAGKSSRMPQSRVRGSILATCSRLEGLPTRESWAEPQKSLCNPCDWTFHSRTSRQHWPASSRLWHATWLTRDWVAKTGQKWFLKFSVFKNKILSKNS